MTTHVIWYLILLFQIFSFRYQTVTRDM